MKRSPTLRETIADLWADAPTTRTTAATDLIGFQVGDVMDVRTAQPALVWAMGDPDPAVRLAAVQATEMRAELGADVRLAVPALLELADDPDVELRRRVWRTLRYANERDPVIDELPELLARGLADPDAQVTEQARAVRDHTRA